MPGSSRAEIFVRFMRGTTARKYSSSELSLDHVVPISRGGKSTWENVVCACLPCNVRKGNKVPGESDMRLIRRNLLRSLPTTQPSGMFALAAPSLPPALTAALAARRAATGNSNVTADLFRKYQSCAD